MMGITNQLGPTENLTKREEVEASLKYLKGKEVKTRKDKEAIQMLEAVLNNI